MYIYLDLETIRGPEMEPLSEFEAPSNYTKPETIQAYRLKAQQEAWEKQSLTSILGNVCVLCASVNDKEIRAFSTTTYEGEREIITSFWDYLLSHGVDPLKQVYFVGFNLRRFDLNWMYHRALKYGMRELAMLIPRARYDKRVIDLMELWQGGNNNEKGKLDQICRYLGKDIKDKIDGSQVYEYWSAGKINEIIEHCMADIERVKFLHPIMDPAFVSIKP